MLFVFLDIKAAHHNINQTKEQRRIVRYRHHFQVDFINV